MFIHIFNSPNIDMAHGHSVALIQDLELLNASLCTCAAKSTTLVLRKYINRHQLITQILQHIGILFNCDMIYDTTG